MDWKDIDRLRVQGFTIARRGYDKREVDKFLDGLVEWLETDAPKDLGGMAVKRKLELAGKSTAQILLTTENERQEMLRQAEEESEDLRARAQAAAVETRRAADDYSRKAREKADEDAGRTTEAAEAKAKRVIEEGERRRAQIEAVLAQLETRRDTTLEELQRLHGELAATIEEHGGGASSDRRNGGKAATRGKPAKAGESVET
jgi:DivIVA domain-containing protein